MPSPPAPPRESGAAESAANCEFGPIDAAAARLEGAITRVVRLARPRLHRPALAKVGGGGLDPAAYATLLWIAERPGCRLTELAGLLAVDTSTASRQVQALELTGLVCTARDPADQRAKLLTLSVKGAALLARARAAREAAVTALVRDWEHGEVEALAVALERLGSSLGCAAEAPSGDRAR